MTTTIIFWTFVLLVAVGLLVYRAVPTVRTYFTYRGKRLVTCPETLKTEAVDVAARKAAVAAYMGDTHIYVSTGAHAGLSGRTAGRSA